MMNIRAPCSRLLDFSAGAATAVIILCGTKLVFEWVQAKKPVKSAFKKQTPYDTTSTPSPSTWPITSIGVVRSVYRLCVGTPRQGLLAPHAKGRIELLLPYDQAKDAVDGIADFSHIWIVFVFHLNTSSSRHPRKISAPARGGSRRVGVYATRSPHRGAPPSVGLTLARLEGIQTVYESQTSSPSGGKKPRRRIALTLSGVDLVDGTPVLDIKPYVHTYDSVSDAFVPEWVERGLATRRRVEWSKRANAQLHEDVILKSLDFLESHENVRQCVTEVLAVDVRSAFQTKKARAGNFQAERSKRIEHGDSYVVEEGRCTQQLDNLIISYDVKEPPENTLQASVDSGAEDSVIVQSIRMIHSK